jgi:predicted transcriptional regulator
MASKPKATKPKADPLVIELDAIKRLLVLQLITSGVQANDIAAALGVHQSTVSRLIPTRKVKSPSKR